MLVLLLLVYLAATADHPSTKRPSTESAPQRVPAEHQPPQSARTFALPPELTRPGPAHGPVITPAGAKSVLKAMWRTRELAGAQDNIPMYARIESGAAREWDVAETRMVHAGRERTVRWARPMDAVRVLVPRQTRYPATFLAIVQTRFYARGEGQGDALNEYLVFRRDARDRPWRVALATSTSGAPFDRDPLLSAPGNAPPRSAWVTPSTAFRDLARYWQSWLRGGHAPAGSRFVPGYFTTEFGARNHADAERVSWARRVSYFAGRDPVYAFGLRGGTLACSTIRGIEAQAAGPGRFFVQTPDRWNWNPTIPPGRYRSITSDFLHQSCIWIAPDRGAGMQVLGNDGDDVRVHAVPAA